ncbi:MAG TPA: hypothetical protein ENJ08_13745 [Gammaproteobacteria bacterium]|nr:hypothetical protein [Gammaproteobacteria bacterium]
MNKKTIDNLIHITTFTMVATGVALDGIPIDEVDIDTPYKQSPLGWGLITFAIFFYTLSIVIRKRMIYRMHQDGIYTYLYIFILIPALLYSCYNFIKLLQYL